MDGKKESNLIFGTIALCALFVLTVFVTMMVFSTFVSREAVFTVNTFGLIHVSVVTTLLGMAAIWRPGRPLPSYVARVLVFCGVLMGLAAFYPVVAAGAAVGGKAVAVAGAGAVMAAAGLAIGAVVRRGRAEGTSTTMGTEQGDS